MYFTTCGQPLGLGYSHDLLLGSEIQQLMENKSSIKCRIVFPSSISFTPVRVKNSSTKMLFGQMKSVLDALGQNRFFDMQNEDHCT